MNELIKDRIQARTEHTNKLNKYINKVIPEIMDILKEGYELKNDGTLYKKYYDKVYNVINKNKPLNIRCYLDSGMNSGYLKIDIYNQEGFNTRYIKDYVYLWSNDNSWNEKNEYYIKESKLSTSFIKRPIKTLNQVINTINKINKLKNKKSLIDIKILDTEKGFNNYLAK